ncbi:MAG: ABC transporter substrate-binding protein [Chloroflexota bacterium]|nr:ABC transporter substrate-binding protein [Chloroflexota bacterium]
MKLRPLIIVLAVALSACGGSAAPSPSAAGSSAKTSPPAPSAAASQAPSPSSSSAAASSPAAINLKVAFVPSTLFAPLFLAIDKGYLQAQGLKVELTNVAAGQDAMAFLSNGQLDAAVGGISAGTFNAINQGLDVRIVASMGAAPAGRDPSALMVRSDETASGAIKSPADLKGKKIGITGGNGSTGAYYLAKILAGGHLTPKDVDLENLSFPNQVVGFKNKAIDAALPAAPFTTEILSQKTAEIASFGHLEAGRSGVGVMYGSRLLTKQPDLGKKLLAALIKGAADASGPHAKDPANLEILAKYTKLPVQTLQTIALYDFRPDLSPDTDTYLDMQKVFIQAGWLKLAQPLPAEKIVSLTPRK